MCQKRHTCLSNTLVFTLGTMVGLSLTKSVSLMDLHTMSVVGFAAMAFYTTQKIQFSSFIKKS